MRMAEAMPPDHARAGITTAQLVEAELRIDEALRIWHPRSLFSITRGTIEVAAGRSEDARQYLADALSIDAGWPATGAADARTILVSLD
jgi:hypothetical protein